MISNTVSNKTGLKPCKIKHLKLLNDKFKEGEQE